MISQDTLQTLLDGIMSTSGGHEPDRIHEHWRGKAIVPEGLKPQEGVHLIWCFTGLTASPAPVLKLVSELLQQQDIDPRQVICLGVRYPGHNKDRDIPDALMDLIHRTSQFNCTLRCHPYPNPALNRFNLEEAMRSAQRDTKAIRSALEDKGIVIRSNIAVCVSTGASIVMLDKALKNFFSSVMLINPMFALHAGDKRAIAILKGAHDVCCWPCCPTLSFPFGPRTFICGPASPPFYVNRETEDLISRQPSLTDPLLPGDDGINLHAAPQKERDISCVSNLAIISKLVADIAEKLRLASTNEPPRNMALFFNQDDTTVNPRVSTNLVSLGLFGPSETVPVHAYPGDHLTFLAEPAGGAAGPRMGDFLKASMGT